MLVLHRSDGDDDGVLVTYPARYLWQVDVGGTMIVGIFLFVRLLKRSFGRRR